MNNRILAFLWAFSALFLTAFGQRNPVRETLGEDIRRKGLGDVVIMPRMQVFAHPELSDKIRVDLERRFLPKRKDFGLVVIENEFDKTAIPKSLEESALFEFGMRGQELKALKGGFEIGGLDLYIKSGLSWHPPSNRYVTVTLGKKTFIRYAYWNFYDASAHVLRNPIMFINEKILERPVYALLDKMGL